MDETARKLQHVRSQQDKDRSYEGKRAVPFAFQNKGKGTLRENRRLSLKGFWR